MLSNNHLNIYVIDTINYRLAREKLVGKGCNSCNNGTCRVLDKTAGCNCLGWQNSSLVKKAVVFENYDINKLQSIPDFDGEVILDAELPNKRIDFLNKGCKIKKLS